MKRKIVIIILTVAIMAGIFKLQNFLHSKTSNTWKQESFSYLPDNKRIGDYMLGFKTTVSHYLWIRTVIYFGGHYTGDKQFAWIVNMLDIITKLNPNFYPAYEFAGVLLPDITNNPDASRILLERGLANCKTKQWNIAFQMGMLYYKHYKDNYTAARYIELASKASDAPVTKLAGVAATFYKNSGNSDYGLGYLKFMYETSDNPEVKRHLLIKIDKIFKDSKINFQ